MCDHTVNNQTKSKPFAFLRSISLSMTSGKNVGLGESSETAGTTADADASSHRRTVQEILGSRLGSLAGRAKLTAMRKKSPTNFNEDSINSLPSGDRIVDDTDSSEKRLALSSYAEDRERLQKALNAVCDSNHICQEQAARAANTIYRRETPVQFRSSRDIVS
eukprot:scaffold250322_cov52-Prasinocladus_malaysianus.AAC.2